MEVAICENHLLFTQTIAFFSSQDLLTKMRQAVDHPYLIVYSQKNIDKRREQVANGSIECDICHEPPTDRVLSSCCGAGVCRSCVIDYLTGAGGENTPCPSCQAPFSIDLNQASVEDTVDDGTLMIAPADKSNGTGSSAMPLLKELTHVATGSILRRIKLVYAMSSKIEVLIQELIEMRQQHRLFSVCEHAGPDPMEAALGPVFSEDGLRCAHPTWRNEREKQR
jgi:DNA repair protein RAD16